MMSGQVGSCPSRSREERNRNGDEEVVKGKTAEWGQVANAVPAGPGGN